MTYFYSYLKEGKTKNEALQLAKLEYIKNSNEEVLKHPYYWAGFILSGDMMALKTTDDTLSYGGILLVAVLISGMLILMYFKRKNKKV